MTSKAKEKADELVEKYKPFVYCYMGSGMLSNTYDEDVVLNMTKQCSLIAVEEVINSMTVATSIHLPYWQEVKQEIEKL